MDFPVLDAKKVDGTIAFLREIVVVSFGAEWQTSLRRLLPSTRRQ